MMPDRDAAAVVGHGARVVGVDGDDDGGAVAGEGLVDGVVDDLVDEVVEASGARGADVHAGPFADRLEALEDLDVLGVIVDFFTRPRNMPRGWARDRGAGEPACLSIPERRLRATLRPWKTAANRRFL